MSIIPNNNIPFTLIKSVFGGAGTSISLKDYFSDSSTGYTTGISGIPTKFNAQNIQNPISISMFIGKQKNVNVTGQILYSTPGTYQFTIPTNVTSICVVAVGGGGGGGSSGGTNGPGGSGGGGGALAYKNNWVVTPGQIAIVVVGAGGPGETNGGSSSFSFGVNTMTAGGGIRGLQGATNYSAGGTRSGYFDSGGNGGRGAPGGPDNGDDGTPGGGGGAGGYSGNGGDGGQARAAAGGLAGQAGSGGGGGGGGGGNGTYEYSANGGGVGIYGQGTNGAGGSSSSTGPPNPGKGGSGGTNGEVGFNTSGGNYGGGGGGMGGAANSSITALNPGGDGVVRIIWGPNRSFPNTNTNDMIA